MEIEEEEKDSFFGKDDIGEVDGPSRVQEEMTLKELGDEGFCIGYDSR